MFRIQSYHYGLFIYYYINLASFWSFGMIRNLQFLKGNSLCIYINTVSAAELQRWLGGWKRIVLLQRISLPFPEPMLGISQLHGIAAPRNQITPVLIDMSLCSPTHTQFKINPKKRDVFNLHLTSSSSCVSFLPL